MQDYSKRKVLTIYTGGTIGATDKPLDQGFLLEPGSLDNLKKNIPKVEKLPYNISWKEFKHKGRFIDSSNVNVDFFNNLASEIGASYKQFDGFVVIMGTDTMEDTSAATAYLLEGLRKPVVFTGSMIPADKPNSDGPINLIDSIEIAAKSGRDIPAINESVICFNNKIIRGVCSRKYHAHAFDAFDSPNHSVLGNIRNDGSIIIYEKELLSKPINHPELRVNKFNKEFRIGALHLIPGIAVEKLLDSYQDLNALLVYGMELNKNSKILPMIQKIKNFPIFYMGTGETPDPNWLHNNEMLLPRQALVKIHYILSRTKDLVEIKRLYEANLRGEVEGPIVNESDIIKESGVELNELHEPWREGKLR